MWAILWFFLLLLSISFLLCSYTFQTGLFSRNLILTNCFLQNLVVTDTICQTPLDPSTIHSADAQFHHTIIGLICYRAVFISRASPVFVWTFCAALIGFIDLPSERSGSQRSPSAQITERLWPSHWYFTNFCAPLWPKLSNQNHSCANTPLCVITQNVLIKKLEISF